MEFRSNESELNSETIQTNGEDYLIVNVRNDFITVRCTGNNGIEDFPVNQFDTNFVIDLNSFSSFQFLTIKPGIIIDYRFGKSLEASS